MNFWAFYFVVAIVVMVYMLYCFIREKEKDVSIYIATVVFSLIWPLTAAIFIVMIYLDSKEDKKKGD